MIDTALYLDVTAGTTPTDADRARPPDRPFADAARTPPGRLRIALSEKPVRALAPPIVDDRVTKATAETGELLRSLGHQVDGRDPSFGAAGNHLTTLYLAGIHQDAAALPHPERLEKRTRGLARLGGLYPGAAIKRAKRLRDTYSARVNRIFDDFDVLITPTLGALRAAHRAPERRGDAALARGPARGRAALGGSSPPGQLSRAT